LQEKAISSQVNELFFKRHPYIENQVFWPLRSSSETISELPNRPEYVTAEQVTTSCRVSTLANSILFRCFVMTVGKQYRYSMTSDLMAKLSHRQQQQQRQDKANFDGEIYPSVHEQHTSENERNDNSDLVSKECIALLFSRFAQNSK
jgi:hypothetical protein